MADNIKNGNANESSAASSLPNDIELQEFFSQWEMLCQEDISSQDYYFNSYAHFGVHEEMLKDSIRTGAYQRAILDNHHLFRDKIVLDVGSGTGILCLFAAKAGAKHVYGIECAEIVEMAKKITTLNKMNDRITYVKGKAEEVELPVEKVDIILSEWMGYFLLYESMLDSVLFCRDKWLKPNGLIFPDRAALYIAAIEDAEYKEEKVGYWRDVYGFDYSCVKPCILEEPIVDSVDENAIATTQCCILDLNLNTCKKEFLNFCAPYKLFVTRRDFLHAFVAWFDITFTACHKPVGFTTAPFSGPTHWKQTVLYMEDVLIADKKDVVEGIIAVRKSAKNHRDLDIKISYKFNCASGSTNRTQFYRLR
ncbi:histone arginine methyltransferase PRMT1 [Cardiosporidium cionae]|uniref:Histone arginine methyltransferase PRMT1 n=1 Tax=Cardiosporidium cionae TaxID=476202 RepID=A0ABQ7JCY8_9APIC|nr:histone arginine methyltransferase PRMT1 [Cardiosporidium cionae]|eukprot:KAF8821846.1 histone arginine methyltransferase PRMT1 [Cardiosporidium cionae]